MRKIKELEDRIKELEDFKYDYELKQEELTCKNKFEKLMKKYKVKLNLFIQCSRENYYFCLSYKESYLACVKINNDNLMNIDTDDINNYKDVYSNIDYDELEKEIKIYLFDNKNKKTKKGERK